jgi:hypothetical protein
LYVKALFMCLLLLSIIWNKHQNLKAMYCSCHGNQSFYTVISTVPRCALVSWGLVPAHVRSTPDTEAGIYQSLSLVCASYLKQTRHLMLTSVPFTYSLFFSKVNINEPGSSVSKVAR